MFKGAPRQFFCLCICFFSDRRVKLQIRPDNLNEEQREVVEQRLTETVQDYVRFNSNPSIEAFTEHVITVYQVSLRTVVRQNDRFFHS